MISKPISLLSIAIVFLIIGFILVLWLVSQLQQESIDSFEDCAAAGNPIMESYPARCSANGQTFTEDISQ